MAVKVTDVPIQQGLMEAVIEMDTGKTGLTVIEMEFDTPGFITVQLNDERTWQVTKSPLTGE